MPEVSVIIPVYNVEPYIKESLGSLKKQTFQDFEALCVDDCGTDNSIEIVKEFAKDDERFKIISCGENKGPSYARNIGMEKMQGKYLFFLDPDDIMNPTEIAKAVKCFKETNADSVWFDFVVYKEKRNELGVRKGIDGNQDADNFYAITPQNILECPVYLWNKAYKTSVIRDLNLTFPEGLFYQDSEFYFKLFTNIKRINYIQEPLYCYRVREGSTVTRSQSGDLKRIEDLFIIFNHIYDYAKEKGIYEEYKWAFLKMAAIAINWERSYPDKEKILKLSKDLLYKVDFPNAFSEFARQKSSS